MYVIIKSDENAYYLKDNTTFTIGRRGVDIALIDDLSVSRKHAKISVRNGKVYLKEIKASNKTYLNGSELKPGIEVEIKIGNEIRFGNKDSIYILQHDKLIVTTSGLRTDDKIVLDAILKEFNGTLVSKWSPECTHIVINNFLMTSKVLCALISRQPIVTIEYFKSRLKAMQQSNVLPNIKNFQQDITDSKLQRNFQIDYNMDRTRLFKNKIFVFGTDKGRKKMEDVIQLAGGLTETYDKNKIEMENFLNVNPEYIIVVENNPEEENSDFQKCIEYIIGRKRRTIPSHEIAFAIQIGDCSINCNPQFNRIEHLLSGERIIYNSEVLVSETNALSAILPEIGVNEIILDSESTDDTMYTANSQTPEDDEMKRKAPFENSQILKKQKNTLFDTFLEKETGDQSTFDQNVSLTTRSKRKLIHEKNNLDENKTLEVETPKQIKKVKKDKNKSFLLKKLKPGCLPNKAIGNEDSKEYSQKKIKKNEDIKFLKNKKTKESVEESPSKKIKKSLDRNADTEHEETHENNLGTKEPIEMGGFKVTVLSEESFLRKDLANLKIASGNNNSSPNYKKFKKKNIQRQTRIISTAETRNYVCNVSSSDSDETDDEIQKDEVYISRKSNKIVKEKFKFNF